MTLIQGFNPFGSLFGELPSSWLYRKPKGSLEPLQNFPLNNTNQATHTSTLLFNTSPLTQKRALARLGVEASKPAMRGSGDTGTVPTPPTFGVGMGQPVEIPIASHESNWVCRFKGTLVLWLAKETKQNTAFWGPRTKQTHAFERLSQTLVCFEIGEIPRMGCFHERVPPKKTPSPVFECIFWLLVNFF